MKREIKFRAWNFEKRRLYPVMLSSLPTGQGFEIMQFTGLLDKSGKEIYEGDVIRLIPEKVDVVVEWDIRQVGFVMRETKNIGRYHADLGGYTRDAFEIIGNIYENPELLK